MLNPPQLTPRPSLAENVQTLAVGGTKTLEAEKRFSFSVSNLLVHELRLVTKFTGEGSHNADTILHSLEVLAGSVPVLSLNKDVNGYYTASQLARILNIVQERNPNLHHDAVIVRSAPYLSARHAVEVTAKVSPEATIGGTSFGASANLEAVTTEVEAGIPMVPAYNTCVVERARKTFSSYAGVAEVVLPPGRYDDEGLFFLVQDDTPAPADNVFTTCELKLGEKQVPFKSRESFMQLQMSRDCLADPTASPLVGFYHVPLLGGLDATRDRLVLDLTIPAADTFSVTPITVTRHYH